jgi:hypothetical protein
MYDGRSVLAQILKSHFPRQGNRGPSRIFELSLTPLTREISIDEDRALFDPRRDPSH